MSKQASERASDRASGRAGAQLDDCLGGCTGLPTHELHNKWLIKHRKKLYAQEATDQPPTQVTCYALISAGRAGAGAVLISARGRESSLSPP